MQLFHKFKETEIIGFFWELIIDGHVLNTWKIVRIAEIYVKPAVGHMEIKAPNESELPSLFMTEVTRTVHRSFFKMLCFTFLFWLYIFTSGSLHNVSEKCLRAQWFYFKEAMRLQLCCSEEAQLVL